MVRSSGASSKRRRGIPLLQWRVERIGLTEKHVEGPEVQPRGSAFQPVSVGRVEAVQPLGSLKESPVRRNEAMTGRRGRDNQAICGIAMEVGEPHGSDTDVTVDGDLHHAFFFGCFRRHAWTSSARPIRLLSTSMATSQNEIADTASSLDCYARSISRRVRIPSLRSSSRSHSRGLVAGRSSDLPPASCRWPPPRPHPEVCRYQREFRAFLDRYRGGFSAWCESGSAGRPDGQSW